LASLFGGNSGQSAQQPSPVQITEEQEQEEEEPLKRKRIHLRFRPLSLPPTHRGRRLSLDRVSKKRSSQKPMNLALFLLRLLLGFNRPPLPPRRREKPRRPK
jgi:hypothetical protein